MSLGYSEKHVSVVQIDDKLVIFYTGTDSKVRWTLIDFFTRVVISTGKVSGNLSDAGLSAVAIGDSIYLLQKGGADDNNIYLFELIIEDNQVLFVAEKKNF